MWAVTDCFLVCVMTFVCILRAENIPSPGATSHKAQVEIYKSLYDLPSVVEMNVEKFESSDTLHLTSLDNDGEEIKNNAQYSQQTSISPVIDDSEIVADALEEMVPKANIMDANDAVRIDMVEVSVEKFESSDTLHLTSLDNDGEEIKNNAQYSQQTSISPVIDDSEIVADALEEMVPKANIMDANDAVRNDMVVVSVEKFETSDALHLTSLDNDGEAIENDAQYSQQTSISPVIDDSEIVADALEEMLPKANIMDANDAVRIDMVEESVEKFETSDALHLTSLDNDGEAIENDAQYSQHTSISPLIDDSEILANAVEETVSKEADVAQRNDTILTLWNERTSDISGVKSAVIVWEIDDNFDGKTKDEIDEMDHIPNKTHNLEYLPDARMKRSVDLETLLEIERLYSDDVSVSGEGSGESTTIFFTDSTIEFEKTSSIVEETSTVIDTSTSAKPTSPSPPTPTSPRPSSPQPPSSTLPSTTGPPVTESANLGNATIIITLTLKFTGSFSDIGNESSDTYQQIKQHCEATLTAAYENTPGFYYVIVTSFSNGTSRRKRRAVSTGIIAEYNVFYVMRNVSESYADVSELIQDIREVVLPLLNSSKIGNETVDGDYLRDIVQPALDAKKRELEDVFNAVCNNEGVCSPCYKCSVNGTKVQCGFRCDFYNGNKNCSLDDNEKFKECVCRIDYLPVVTSCVHKDLIIGVSAGVGAVILLAFTSLLVYCARKNSSKSSFSLHKFDDLSVGQENAPSDPAISQDNLSSQASDNGGNSLNDQSACGAPSVVAHHSEGDSLGHPSASGSLGRDNAAYTVDVPELQVDTDIVRRGRLRKTPPFNKSIQLNTDYSSDF